MDTCPSWDQLQVFFGVTSCFSPPPPPAPTGHGFAHPPPTDDHHLISFSISLKGSQVGRINGPPFVAGPSAAEARGLPLDLSACLLNTHILALFFFFFFFVNGAGNLAMAILENCDH